MKIFAINMETNTMVYGS